MGFVKKMRRGDLIARDQLYWNSATWSIAMSDEGFTPDAQGQDPATDDALQRLK